MKGSLTGPGTVLSNSNYIFTHWDSFRLFSAPYLYTRFNTEPLDASGVAASTIKRIMIFLEYIIKTTIKVF